MDKKCLYAFLIGCCVGLSSIYWFGKSKVEEGEKLTQVAETLSVESDKAKFKADSFSLKNLSSLQSIALRDKEIEELTLSQVDFSIIVQKQKEVIVERDLLINGLVEENKQLRIALDLKDKAYRVQLDATKAYQEAMFEAKFKYGLGGTLLGVAIGFAVK